MLQTGSVDLQRLFGHPSDNSTKSSRLIFHSVTIKPTQPSHNGIPANVSQSCASTQRAQVIVLIPTAATRTARSACATLRPRPGRRYRSKCPHDPALLLLWPRFSGLWNPPHLDLRCFLWLWGDVFGQAAPSGVQPRLDLNVHVVMGLHRRRERHNAHMAAKKLQGLQPINKTHFDDL